MSDNSQLRDTQIHTNKGISGLGYFKGLKPPLHERRPQTERDVGQ